MFVCVRYLIFFKNACNQLLHAITLSVYDTRACSVKRAVLKDAFSFSMAWPLR